MKDEAKTREQLIKELKEARTQINIFEKSAPKRKFTEEALEESKNEHQTLFNRAGDAIFLINLDGTYKDANKKACELLGYRRDEFLKKRIEDVVDPKFFIDTKERKEKLLSGAKIEPYEKIFLKKSGERVPVEINVSLEFDKNNKPKHIISIVRDITNRKQAEKALQESESQKEAILDGISTNLAFVNENLEILWVNKASAISAGKSQEEMIGHKCHELWADPEKPCDGCPSLKAWKTRKSEHKIMNTPDGRVWDERGEPVFDQNGELIGMVEIAHDITERKRAEDALVFERAQLLSIFDSIDEVVYITDPNTYEILYVNQAMKDAFQKELIGGVCYREFQGLDSPCEFCTNEIILKQKPASYRWEYHNPILNKDFAIVDRIIKWPDGRDVRFELAIDITERKQAEEKLQQSERNYRNLIEASNDGIYLLYEHKFEIVNKKFQEMLHITRKDLNKPDFDFIDLVAPKSRPLIEERTQKSVRGEKLESTYEFTGLTKDGKEIEFETSVSYVKYKESIATLGIFRDITERKRAEEKLKRSLKEKEVLLQEIHHRVKNNLMVIIGLFHFYTSDLKNKKIKSLLSNIENTIHSIVLIHELLYKSSNLELINFKYYVMELISYLQVMHHMDSSLLNVEIDIGKVFLNLKTAMPCGMIINELISNILKHAFPPALIDRRSKSIKNREKPCHILVHLSAKGKVKSGRTFKPLEYTMVIRDNGVGFPEDYDIRKSRSLGLTLVNLMAKQIDGEVEFENKDGTVITIHFKKQ